MPAMRGIYFARKPRARTSARRRLRLSAADRIGLVGLGSQLERGRLVLDQVLELLPELLEIEPGHGGVLGQLVSVLEVVAPQADHVAARDRVAGRSDVDHPDSCATGAVV